MGPKKKKLQKWTWHTFKKLHVSHTKLFAQTRNEGYLKQNDVIE